MEANKVDTQDMPLTKSLDQEITLSNLIISDQKHL